MDCKNILLYVATGCLLVVGRVSAYYNQTNGVYSFILSNVSADNSPSRTSLANAQEWCRSNGYTLATIPDKDVHNYIVQFIKSAVSNSYITIGDLIILNGKLYTDLTGTWVWVTGRPRNSNDIKDQQDSKEHYFYGFLATRDYKIHATTHSGGRSYICEYSGDASNCTNGLPLNGRCYQRFTTSLNWYSARNKCLEGGGDLASFETLTDGTFNSTLGSTLLSNAPAAAEFWVGMQRVEWRWEDTDLAIKYTNWESGSPSNAYDCLCLRMANSASEWLWYDFYCSRTYRIICMGNAAMSTTTLIVTEKAPSNKSVSRSDPPTPSSSIRQMSTTAISSQLNTNGAGSADVSLALGLGIGLGVGAVLVVVAVVVVVIFCIRRRQKSESNASSSSANIRNDLKDSATEASTAEYEEIKDNGTNNDNASIPMVKSGAIYASVQPNGTPLPPTTDAETNGKQIDYAQFDLGPNSQSKFV